MIHWDLQELLGLVTKALMLQVVYDKMHNEMENKKQVSIVFPIFSFHGIQFLSMLITSI